MSERATSTRSALRWFAAISALTLSSTAHGDGGDRWDGLTIGVQVGGGALGVASGVLGGGVVGGLLGSVDDHSGKGALVGSAIGAEIGLIVGVHWVGSARGGSGAPWATTIGALTGTVLVSSIVAANEKWDLGLSPPALVAIGATLVLAGPIVGYHLSADDRAVSTSPRTVMIPIVVTPF